MTRIYDLFVIGGGSGGMACARRAASHGAKVGVAEGKRWGGTCVNVGCVPKKIMWWSSTVADILREAHQYGFGVNENVSVDWSYLKKRRDASVLRLNGMYKANLEKDQVDKFESFASFTGPAVDGIHTIRVGDRDIQTRNVLIAVGGRPSLAGVPGEEELTINSDGFFDLETQPRKAAVIGAGYIAVELAGVLNGLGTETHLFTRGEKALRKFDPMLMDEVTAGLVKTGVVHHPGTTPVEFVKQEDGKKTYQCKTETGDIQTFTDFDCILVAIGRQPEIDKLNLDALKPRLEFKGKHIAADEYQRTNLPGIFALGDVCGKVELTPMAIAAGRRLGDRLFLPGSETARASYDNVPTVVFSHPPIATIGLTEPEAREKYGHNNIVVYNGVAVNLYYNVFDVSPSEKPKMRLKMICVSSEDELVVGIHVAGMGSDEMIQGFGVAMKMGAKKRDYDSVVAVHPSAAEELVTLAPWGLPHPDRQQKLDTTLPHTPVNN